MIKHNDIIRLMRKITQMIHSEIGIDCIIAGGAVRDVYLGNDAKDIDVYVNTSDENIKKLSGLFNGVIIQNGHYSESKGIKHVIKGSLIEDPGDIFPPIYEVDIINDQSIDPSSINTVFDTFDIGLCMAAFKDDNIWLSDKFYRDSIDKTLTFYRGENIKHAERLQKKYPYEIVGLRSYMDEDI